ncbi:MAG: hypothetical protein R3247_13210, partial [Rhodothermales bacterium]|nr:hypothetical protein [Rhodothermales bacterium]
MLLSACAAVAYAQAPGDTVRIAVPGTDVAMTFAYIPAGTFTMGSPENEPGRDADEGPPRRVT